MRIRAQNQKQVPRLAKGEVVGEKNQSRKGASVSRYRMPEMWEGYFTRRGSARVQCEKEKDGVSGVRRAACGSLYTEVGKGITQGQEHVNINAEAWQGVLHSLCAWPPPPA
jgi:hypothetical protein